MIPASRTVENRIKNDARLHGVAVLTVGRSDFERYLDRPLTEEEWGRVATQNTDLDAWVGDNVIHSFIRTVLSYAGVPKQKEDR